MKKKILTVFLTFVVLFTAVLVKAFYIQVLNREKLISYSNSQVVREAKVYPKRGQILDRHGEPLAINVRTYNIFTIPRKGENYSKSYKKLSKILPSVNYKELLSQVKRRQKYTWIARKVELSEKEFSQIKELPGIYADEDYSRVYPNHEMLAQVLGFVGIDNEGLSGIEYEFNDKLKGKAHVYKYFRDAKGRPVKYESIVLENKAEDITLSIDKDVQASVEKYLKEEVEAREAIKGGAAVMDATTGEIWAMANYPTFDPNHYSDYQTKYRKLSFITDPFEPGSVFKALTVASGLENNLIRPDTNYYCEKGRFRVGSHFIKESDTRHAHEWLTVTDIMKLSSNIGTTKIAFDLGYPILKDTLKKFNIGQKTGIELSGESRGILEDAEKIKDIKLSNISFGHGVATTGLQMLASYAAIANGGNYVKPTILKVKKDQKVEKKRIIKNETAEELINMLTLAVEDGTGKKAKIPHFVIAGKTSTAQRVSETGGYKGYIPGFIGFPVNVPKRFVVFVYIEDPKKGYYGATVAAPVFQKITKSILYRKREYSQLAIADEKIQIRTLDQLKVSSSAARTIQKGLMPNLIGLDKSSAQKILEELEIYYDFKGYGVVKSQSVEAGEKVSTNTKVKVNFEIPSYE